ncbi:hypothetical protein V6x_13170 [Gimesia chilikensis]|uniref:Uncharacterized protein n=1 Tax=Gimesia chilikensis TaxID=2605989 RepID=A0A517W8Q5_9PLAN|nr:hypothetical protein V6x_13170 [Gimesia chilikensis]
MCIICIQIDVDAGPGISQRRDITIKGIVADRHSTHEGFCTTVELNCRSVRIFEIVIGDLNISEGHAIRGILVIQYNVAFTITCRVSIKVVAIDA